jgi:hypothetical protein
MSLEYTFSVRYYRNLRIVLHNILLYRDADLGSVPTTSFMVLEISFYRNITTVTYYCTDR